MIKLTGQCGLKVPCKKKKKVGGQLATWGIRKTIKSWWCMVLVCYWYSSSLTVMAMGTWWYLIIPFCWILEAAYPCGIAKYLWFRGFDILLDWHKLVFKYPCVTFSSCPGEGVFITKKLMWILGKNMSLSFLWHLSPFIHEASYCSIVYWPEVGLSEFQVCNRIPLKKVFL